uniref:Uncharacterized protein n=1 Tax=Triticum urartu TaxID=4572 RepID=A0A8R7P6W0_TRIUA
MTTAGGHPVVVLHRAEEPSSQGVRVGVGPNGGVHLWCLMRVVGLDVDGEMSIVVVSVAAGVVSVCHGCFSCTNGTIRCARGVRMWIGVLGCSSRWMFHWPSLAFVGNFLRGFVCHARNFLDGCAYATACTCETGFLLLQSPLLAPG